MSSEQERIMRYLYCDLLRKLPPKVNRDKIEDHIASLPEYESIMNSLEETLIYRFTCDFNGEAIADIFELTCILHRIAGLERTLGFEFSDNEFAIYVDMWFEIGIGKKMQDLYGISMTEMIKFIKRRKSLVNV